MMAYFKEKRWLIVLVIVLGLTGYLLFVKNTNVGHNISDQQVVANLKKTMDLPAESTPLIRTVATTEEIPRDDAFFTDAADDFLVISYPGLDILYDSGAERVIRSRSYVPGTMP